MVNPTMCVEKSIVGLSGLGSLGLRVLKPFRIAGGFQNLISTMFYFVGAFYASKIVIGLKYLTKRGEDKSSSLYLNWRDSAPHINQVRRASAAAAKLFCPIWLGWASNKNQNKIHVQPCHFHCFL